MFLTLTRTQPLRSTFRSRLTPNPLLLIITPRNTNRNRHLLQSNLKTLNRLQSLNLRTLTILRHLLISLTRFLFRVTSVLLRQNRNHLRPLSVNLTRHLTLNLRHLINRLPRTILRIIPSNQRGNSLIINHRPLNFSLHLRHNSPNLRTALHPLLLLRPRTGNNSILTDLFHLNTPTNRHLNVNLDLPHRTHSLLNLLPLNHNTILSPKSRLHSLYNRPNSYHVPFNSHHLVNANPNLSPQRLSNSIGIVHLHHLNLLARNSRLIRRLITFNSTLTNRHLNPFNPTRHITRHLILLNRHNNQKSNHRTKYTTQPRGRRNRRSRSGSPSSSRRRITKTLRQGPTF